MKKLIIGVVALALAACSTADRAALSTTLGTASAPSRASIETCPSGSFGARTLADEKRLYDAEALYNVPAHAYVVADANDQLPFMLKQTVKPFLQQAYSALKLARAAYCAGNSEGLLNQYNAVKLFANQAKALLPDAG